MTVTQSFKPLSQVTGANGVVTLRAYCDVIGQTVTVTYSVDGKWIGTQDVYKRQHRCRTEHCS